MELQISTWVARIAGIAVKPERGAPLVVVESVRLTEEGLEGGVRQRAERRTTFLSGEQWAQVGQELNSPLPWTTRRASILVEGLGLAATLGRSLQLGDLRVHINGETKPCWQMEAAQAGPWNGLKPERRGGSHRNGARTDAVQGGDTIWAFGESNSPSE